MTDIHFCEIFYLAPGMAHSKFDQTVINQNLIIRMLNCPNCYHQSTASVGLTNIHTNWAML